MASVTFRNVTKRFGDFVALDALDLEVQDEEFIALVGPSGSGKSTALRVLAGLEAISAGEIYIGDRPVSRVAAKDRDIAMVFQSYALYPHMSVYDNIAFGLKVRKVPKSEIRASVHQAAQILGIEDLLARKPRALSGGQRQRVALGRAIVRHPAVFLLDEPLSNLDAKLRVQTRAELTRLHQRLRTTFVYVTHDQVEAMTMADRIAVLDHGVLQQVGTPRDLYDHPANQFVAGFIGSPAMNLFEATIEDAEGGILLAADGLAVPIRGPHAGALSQHRGRRLLIGIRPENIHDPDFEPSGIDRAPFTATVDVTEQLGSEVIVHLTVGAAEMLARTDPRTTAQPGEQRTFILDASRLHAFEPETGLSIGL
jgi:multiple sugar transport system ATP-binding protein